MALETAISGLLVGILFGMVLQRGRVCFNSAIRDPVIFKDFTLIKAILTAIFVSMIGFSIMILSGLVDPSPKPFQPFAQVIGGFVFGIGMVLAGACASGVSYKTGEGLMTAFLGLLGLALGASAAATGILKGAREYLQGLLSISNLTWVGVIDPAGDITTYAATMLLAGIVLTALMTLRFILPSYRQWRTERSGSLVETLFKKNWQWWLAGISLAVVNMVAWAVSFAATTADPLVPDRNYPLSITDGWLGILGLFQSGTVSSFETLVWPAWMVLGLVLGSFIGARVSGEYRLSSPKTGKPILIAFIGGLLLGVGAVFSQGCNITNMLSGIPLLSVGSLVFTIFMMFGVWFAALTIFRVIKYDMQ
ncbi:MAG: YeeE/YedE family protein [Candidatus Thorarchaeota archaeon]